jgi:3-oxoadipate enol-lactonase
MSFAEINEIKICYEISGEGYPVILIHGFGSKKESWNAQVGAFSKYFRVIRLDNRGAGKSDRPDEPLTMDIIVEDIKGLMDFLQIEKAHIIGWSLGGTIVACFVLKYPERVSKVVLINAVFRISGVAGDTAGLESYKRMRLDDLELRKKDPEAAFWKSSRMDFHREFRKELEDNPKKKFHGIWSAEDLIKESTIDPPTARDIENQAHALAEQDHLDRFSEIKNKTLIIAASHDRICPKSVAIDVHEKIPNSILKVIEKAGHGSPRSRAPEINQIIIDFLKE